ncbi:MAG: Lrp/AsnC family transcriptional regulator [Thaumarchaeota archaeon]|nr:Lrp/AsnC family transcriptional regulator [Nitrososphaerota archaeon]
MAKAYVLITCESGSEDFVLSSLRSIDSVKLATGVFGTYDILSKLEAGSEDSLKDIITKKIRKLPRIRATYTLMADDKNALAKKIDGRDVLDTYMSQAYILLDCEKGKEVDTMHNLSKIAEIIDGDVLFTSQVICNVVAPTYNEISDVVTKKIRKLAGIKGTTTLNVINHKPR